VVAPYGFDSNYELSVGLVLSALVVMVVLLGHHGQWPKIGRGPLWVVGVALVLGLGVVRVQDHQEDNQGVAWMARNFYGALKVYEVTDGGYLSMLHGQIIHGQQFTDEQRRRQPTSYYTPNAGAGMALLAKAAQGPLKVGVVGVGVGTLVTYGRAGDVYRVYDIDPLVIQMAQEKFTYLRDTAARTEVVLGDARLQLERESAQGYDVLVVDAFSGDSVPIHLLTREAFALYFKHLKPDGVLAVHITNRFLDLLPVVQTAATHFGKAARLVDHEGDRSELSFSSRWVLVSGDATFFDQPALQAAQAIEPRAGFVPWRDDYSSLLSVLK
jgi:spermidine synthase